MIAARRIIFAAIALAVAPMHGSAFAQAGMIELPSVSISQVHIVNSSGDRLHFSIRPAGGEWSQMAIDPGRSETISCDGCQTRTFEFVMRTGDREVRYDLDAAQRYVLEWNAARGLWDILRVAG